MHDHPEHGRLVGTIVETEAYGGADDPASHAWRGMTPRNRVMFGPPGVAYVYFTYGMHHCFNIVCGREGRAMAVLVRALEPVEGVAAMARLAPPPSARAASGAASPRLAAGPGRLTRALGLDLRHDGLDLTTRGPLWLAAPAPGARGRVLTGPRIGIRRAADRPWRYWLAVSPHVSRGGGPGPGGRPRARELR